MRRRKTSTKNQHALQQQRASFPLSRPQLSESRVAQHLEQHYNLPLSHNGDLDSSQDHLEGTATRRDWNILNVLIKIVRYRRCR